jgi:hypothetical protein
MAKAADISTKRLISLAPENWVKWVTKIPDIVCGEIINSEGIWQCYANLPGISKF